jgi:hypothetical protein
VNLVLGSFKDCEATLACGHFTQEYVDALKGLLAMPACFKLFLILIIWLEQT